LKQDDETGAYANTRLGFVITNHLTLARHQAQTPETQGNHLTLARHQAQTPETQGWATPVAPPLLCMFNTVLAAKRGTCSPYVWT
jgi:hypothetical protein